MCPELDEEMETSYMPDGARELIGRTREETVKCDEKSAISAVKVAETVPDPDVLRRVRIDTQRTCMAIPSRVQQMAASPISLDTAHEEAKQDAGGVPPVDVGLAGAMAAEPGESPCTVFVSTLPESLSSIYGKSYGKTME